MLLVITDGNHNARMVTMERVRREAEEHDMAIFAVGLFGDGIRRAKYGRREFSELTERTGGLAYYRDTIDRIDSGHARRRQRDSESMHYRVCAPEPDAGWLLLTDPCHRDSVRAPGCVRWRIAPRCT